MQAANRSTLGKTLVALHELNAFHETHIGMTLEITLPVKLGKITPVVAKSSGPDDFDGIELQRTYL